MSDLINRIEELENQLADANNRLRKAWVKQKDLEIDVDRLETTLKHQRLYSK